MGKLCTPAKVRAEIDETISRAAESIRRDYQPILDALYSTISPYQWTAWAREHDGSPCSYCGADILD